MLKQAAKFLIRLLLSSPGVNNRPEDVPSIKEASKKVSVITREKKDNKHFYIVTHFSPKADRSKTFQSS